MSTANQTAPAGAPESGIRQPAPDGRLHPLVQCSCGSRMFERVTPVHGVWREYVVFNEDGTEDFENSESTTDDLRHGKPPKTMKCGECGKKHRNPDTLNVKELRHADEAERLSERSFRSIEAEKHSQVERQSMFVASPCYAC